MNQTPDRGDAYDAGQAPDVKDAQLDQYRVHDEDAVLTTNQGVPVDDDDNTLRAGERGPSLLEDFHFREKITHFDHERIPERVVHARGAGAYGYFEPYAAMGDVTAARFLAEPVRRTPVFVRFSTVAGSRGSADTVRDVRGFAVKFYTEDGNFDLVGNNMPVFFIQDGVKFPDFVHAVKPEPDNEIPQAASAHDTLWDFVRNQTETTHMMMWLMSDRAIPRSYRMMQGFGVHTFRLVAADGTATFVKFHWRPKLGVHSLVWDEAQKIAGQDPDFNRRDLWEAIANGDFPEWELGFQMVPADREHDFDFDLLDATKIIPEELVPVTPVGRMVLNRNPDNFFAETEQVAFHTGHVVPGIDFTNDPLLQARLFSYLDTQLIRLGGPNFAQLPVNRPLAPVHNNQRDGHHQTAIPQGRGSYSPNSLAGGCPYIAGAGDGYEHLQEHVHGAAVKRRSPSFADHFTQAALFWRSVSDWERDHIVEAFRFELGKCATVEIRRDVVAQLARVDGGLAARVAEGLGLAPPSASGDTPEPAPSPALAIDRLRGDGGIGTRKIAVLAADGVDGTGLTAVVEALTGQGAVCEVVAPHQGPLETDGAAVNALRSTLTMGSPLYDAVLVADGPRAADSLSGDGAAVEFVTEAWRHGKAVGALGAGARLLAAAGVPEDGAGVVTGAGDTDAFGAAFAAAVAAHRHWDR
ncbi:catalase [Yinghuangia sp. ASG 101]|uniref:catalase n=1 Tax=Yinghuangia sp. ASG 101 TaxID=2896848 RepID=UPI001E30BAF7|nr:catalase [Yinghuangia sp. ASG 101]UGQ14875.1 catalase [Yinghuangia sp. ASG 101]